ncbi:MAG: helix-turn-helix domain containing protein, partial [Puniceicoccales bacterium]|nr:helix-turn-helix domain containing protein [Puniceicoccales bacterium]
MRAEIFFVASQILTARFAFAVKYSQDLKNAAVRLVMDGKTYTQVSKELRISPQSVRNWHT